jgi:hypothetical protein
MVWLIAALLYVGAVGRGQLLAEAASRREAFVQADLPVKDKSKELLLSANSWEAEIIRTGKNITVKVPAAFGRTQVELTSQTAVFRNNWDHDQFPLNDQVHIELFGRACVGGGGGIAADAIGFLSTLSGFGRDQLGGLQSSAAESQEIENSRPPELEMAEQRQAEAKKQNEDQIAALENGIARRQIELADTNRELMSIPDKRTKAQEAFEMDKDQEKRDRTMKMLDTREETLRETRTNLTNQIESDRIELEGRRKTAQSGS